MYGVVRLGCCNTKIVKISKTWKGYRNLKFFIVYLIVLAKIYEEKLRFSWEERIRFISFTCLIRSYCFFHQSWWFLNGNVNFKSILVRFSWAKGQNTWIIFCDCGRFSLIIWYLNSTQSNSLIKRESIFMNEWFIYTEFTNIKESLFGLFLLVFINIKKIIEISIIEVEFFNVY